VLNFYDQPAIQNDSELLCKSLEQETGEGTEIIYQKSGTKKSASVAGA